MSHCPSRQTGKNISFNRLMDIAARQRWMGLLARAEDGALTDVWQAADQDSGYERLRGPETGLVMVRGRAGGSGSPFNLGEMTVTRCSVRLADGTVGHAYVAGRRPEHAERAAVIDALMQDDAKRSALEAVIIQPLETRERERRQRRAGESAATKVEFFTLVRGED